MKTDARLYIVFMFSLHYTCSVLRSRNSRKAFSFFQNVWFCYCMEINIVIYVLYTKQRICRRQGVQGVGIVSLCMPGGGE